METFWKSHGNYKKPVNFLALSFEGESWQSLKTFNVLHLLKRIFQNAVFLRKDLLGAVTFLEVSWNFLAAKALPSVLRCLSHTLHCSAHWLYNRLTFKKIVPSGSWWHESYTALKISTKTLNWHCPEAKGRTITWGYHSYCYLSHEKGSVSTSHSDSTTSWISNSYLFQIFHQNTSNDGIWDTLN